MNDTREFKIGPIFPLAILIGLMGLYSYRGDASITGSGFGLSLMLISALLLIITIFATFIWLLAMIIPTIKKARVEMKNFLFFASIAGGILCILTVTGHLVGKYTDLLPQAITGYDPFLLFVFGGIGIASGFIYTISTMK